MIRWLSPSHAISLMRPEIIEYSPLVLTPSTASHTRTWPETSPEATQKPEGENFATVVVVVWPVYCLQSSGLSIFRRKIDLPDYLRC